MKVSELFRELELAMHDGFENATVWVPGSPGWRVAGSVEIEETTDVDDKSYSDRAVYISPVTQKDKQDG